MSKLYRPLTKALKQKLKLSSKGVVIKTTLKSGKPSVQGHPGNNQAKFDLQLQQTICFLGKVGRS